MKPPKIKEVQEPLLSPFRGGGISRTVIINQEATKDWFLTFSLREVLKGTPGSWEIEIQYKVTGGNLTGYPNQDEFDIYTDFSYETASGASTERDASLGAYSAQGWMDQIGQDYQTSYFGSVYSNYNGSPALSFSSIRADTSPSISVSM